MKTVATLHCRRSLFIVCIISLLCLSATASAADEGKMVSERAKAVIGGKGPAVLILSENGFDKLHTNRLVVPYNPMIFDENGRAIELSELKIPCEADVEYRRSGDKDPVLFRLEVRAYGADANSYFTEKDTKDKLPE